MGLMLNGEKPTRAIASLISKLLSNTVEYGSTLPALKLSILHCANKSNTVSPCFGENTKPLSLDDGKTTATFLITGSSEYVLSK